MCTSVSVSLPSISQSRFVRIMWWPHACMPVSEKTTTDRTRPTTSVIRPVLIICWSCRIASTSETLCFRGVLLSFVRFPLKRRWCASFGVCVWCMCVCPNVALCQFSFGSRRRWQRRRRFRHVFGVFDVICVQFGTEAGKTSKLPTCFGLFIKLRNRNLMMMGLFGWCWWCAIRVPLSSVAAVCVMVGVRLPQHAAHACATFWGCVFLLRWCLPLLSARPQHKLANILD